jgi:hypothetical protein
MKVLVQLNLVQHEEASAKKLTVDVGDGKQTIRWLATVAAARAKEGQLLRDECPENKFIVTGIRNADGKLINPTDCICEHTDPASPKIISLYADIAQEFEADSWGNPSLNSWQVNAFVHSKCGIKWASENEAWREKFNASRYLQDVDENPDDLPTTMPKDRSNIVQIGDDFTQADIETAFSLDWRQIKCAWLPSSSSAASTMESVALTIKNNYALICKIYAHYCGVGQGGAPVICFMTVGSWFNNCCHYG